MKTHRSKKNTPQFHRYKYHHPEAVPFQRTDQWDKEMILAAGFDPQKDDLTFGVLTAAWNGHLAGSVVITGPRKTGEEFAVEFSF